MGWHLQLPRNYQTNWMPSHLVIGLFVCSGYPLNFLIKLQLSTAQRLVKTICKKSITTKQEKEISRKVTLVRIHQSIFWRKIETHEFSRHHSMCDPLCSLTASWTQLFSILKIELRSTWTTFQTWCQWPKWLLYKTTNIRKNVIFHSNHKPAFTNFKFSFNESSLNTRKAVITYIQLVSFFMSYFSNCLFSVKTFIWGHLGS